MRRLAQIFSIVLLIFFGLQHGEAAPIPDAVKHIVTFVFLSDANGQLLLDKEGNPVPQGTAFFVGVPREAGKSEAIVYLVTAKHVLTDESGKLFSTVFLRLNRKVGDAEFVRVQIDPRFVFTHPDPTVDIAVLPLLPPQNTYEYVVLSTDDFASPDKLKKFRVSEGSDVFFTGLLPNYYGGSKNTPIVRFGKVAMFPDQAISWKEKPSDPVTKPHLYLLETQSFGGNSGSPVFFYAAPEPNALIIGQQPLALGGVMRGTLERGRIVEFIPTADLPIYRQNIGIAAVTPAYLVLEILDQKELKDSRQQFFATHPPIDVEPPTGSIPASK